MKTNTKNVSTVSAAEIKQQAAFLIEALTPQPFGGIVIHFKASTGKVAFYIRRCAVEREATAAFQQ